MVAADASQFHGKPAIIRRLNQGVETLAKMAGTEAQLPAFELTGPTAAGNGGMVLKLSIKRGLQRISFTMQFTFEQGRIVLLQNSRC